MENEKLKVPKVYRVHKVC